MSGVVNLPNLITLARLLCAPLVVYMVVEDMLAAAFWTFAVAAASDGVDGFLARVLDARTKVGAWLDPIADKALLVSLFVVLAVERHVPLWLAILAVSRDLMIVGGVLLLQALRQSVHIKPLRLSKLNTLAQLVLVVGVLARDGLGLPDFGAVRLLVYVVAVTTIGSGAAYIVMGLRQLSEVKDDA